MDRHYDRVAGIAGLRRAAWAPTARCTRTDWGLAERVAQSGRIVGLECSDASRRLPVELLDALPAALPQEIVVERQTA